MSIRPDMQSLAEELGTPVPASEPGAACEVPIRHSLYVYYLDIAKREQSSVAAVINDALMKARGEG